MRTNFAIFIVVLHLMAACSGKAPNNESTVTPADGFSEDPVTFAQLVSDVAAEKRNFSGFALEAQKAVVVNTESLREVWIKGISRAFERSRPLPNTDGMALIGKQELRIVTKDAEKTFELAEPSQWRSALHAMTYAFLDANGAISIFRHLEGANWEEFEDEIELGDETFGILISDQGKVVIAINIETGTFNLYAVEDNAFVSQKVCDQSTAAFELQAGAILNDENYLILGSKGTLGAIDLSVNATCPTEDNLLTTELDTDQRLVRIMPGDADAEFFALYEDGEVFRLSFDGTTFSETARFNIGASIDAASLHVIDSEYLIVSSIEERGGKNKSPSKVRFYLADQESGEVISDDFLVDATVTASLSFDAASLKFYQLFDGGSGHLREWDLNTNKTRERKGMFLDGILDDL